ncbi:MAG TPA: hypothetical protein VKK31_09630 [Thermoanaerobaculia bacterium]|nr:hypothetical protein [Thermoanaerobaculia bacterium]
MKRFMVLCLLAASLLAFHAALPEASSSWGCGAGPPQCTYGASNANAQCDALCGGVGYGVCARPGCCLCSA